MRVLFLCRHSVANTAGGVVEYLRYLPPILKNFDIETVIYDMDHDKDYSLQGPQILENGLRSYSGPVIKPGFFVSQKRLRPLIQLCRQEKIDLVHAHGTYRSGFVALELFKRTKIPYVVMSHGDIATTNSDRIKRKRVQRRCREVLRNAIGVVHLTPIMAEASHHVFDTRYKSTVIANGIDLSKWQEQTNTVTQNYVLGIGRLEREKGFHVLIEAYAELRQRGVTTSLVIAGDGSEAAALHALVKRYDLNLVTNHQDARIPEQSVVFTGYIGGDLKQTLMMQSKMILFPTQPSQWEEPFGIVQIEAMAAGKILVASDSLTTRYLQSLGLHARLVVADDPGAWADQISYLLNSPDTCGHLGMQNKNNVKQFDWKEIGKQYRDMYLRQVTTESRLVSNEI